MLASRARRQADDSHRARRHDVTTALFGFAHSEWLLDTARFLQGVVELVLVDSRPRVADRRRAGRRTRPADRKRDGRRDLRRDARARDRRDRVVDEHEATFGGVACRRPRARRVGRRDVVAARAERSARVDACSRALTKRRMLASVWFVALPVDLVRRARRARAAATARRSGSARWRSAASGSSRSRSKRRRRRSSAQISDRRGRVLPLRVGAVGCRGLLRALSRARRALVDVRGR